MPLRRPVAEVEESAPGWRTLCRGHAMNLSLTLHDRTPHARPAGDLRWREARSTTARFETARCSASPARRNAWRRHGIAPPGARVALAMENCAKAAALALYGIWRAGLAAGAHQQQKSSHAREMAWIMADRKSRGLCLAEPQAGRRTGQRPGVSPDHCRPCDRRDRVAPPHYSRALMMPMRLSSVPPADPQGRREAGSSTKRHDQAGRRARCSRIATCCSPATATTPTSTTCGPDDTILHAAPLTHGSGLYGLAHIAARLATASCRRARSSPSACSDALARYANVSHVRRADHGGAAHQSRRRRLGRRARPEDHRLRRRADVRGRPRARARAVRPHGSTSCTARARAR